MPAGGGNVRFLYLNLVIYSGGLVAMKLVGKEETILNHVEKVHESVMKGKEIPNLPKGMKLEDLPVNVRGLYELKSGKVPNGEFAKVLKA